MLPDRVSNPGPLTYQSGALPIALCGLAKFNYCMETTESQENCDLGLICISNAYLCTNLDLKSGLRHYTSSSIIK